jgi:hypothetical protein
MSRYLSEMYKVGRETRTFAEEAAPSKDEKGRCARDGPGPDLSIARDMPAVCSRETDREKEIVPRYTTHATGLIYRAQII